MPSTTLTTAPMKVLISGGGIAGNALAFWLSKIGHQVTVVERFPSLRDTGLQLDLRGHGIEVMRRMGLEKEFRARQAPEQGLQIVDKRGWRWALFPVNRSGKGLQNFTSDFEIMRSDMCRLLYEEAGKNGTHFVFGTSIEALKDQGEYVDVKFDDGKAQKYDLVVGADGVGSQVRKLMLGPNEPNPFHSIGASVGYYLMQSPQQKNEGFMATCYVAPGGRAIMLRRHNPTQLQVYLNCNDVVAKMKDAPRGDVETEKKILADFYQGAGYRTDELLEGLRVSKDFYLERMGYVKMDSWSKGRVVLVGDAGYAPSASAGMGTTTAIVGAYLLAGEIASHCGVVGSSAGGQTARTENLRAAFKDYQTKFAPFVDQVQEPVVKGTSIWSYFPESSAAVFAMYCFVSIAAVLRLNVIAEYILGEKIMNWDLPDYEALMYELRSTSG
jgi:2-polyprenyl-6-methoxyphenol hydroxylase-like FAD-dependent oxidoreductase